MRELICVVCPKGCHLKVDEAHAYAVQGNACARGESYGREECLAPKRTLCSTVATDSKLQPRCPVKSAAPIPRELLLPAMAQIKALRLSLPVQVGAVLLPDLAGTGVALVSSSTLERDR